MASYTGQGQLLTSCVETDSPTDKYFPVADTSGNIYKLSASNLKNLMAQLIEANTPLIQSGQVAITPTEADIPTGKDITFDTPFASAPDVVACSMGSVPGKSVTGVSVTNITTTGCTIYVCRANTNATSIKWIAVGERA